MILADIAAMIDPLLKLVRDATYESCVILLNEEQREFCHVGRFGSILRDNVENIRIAVWN